MNLHPLTIRVRDGVEVAVAPAPAERRDDLVGAGAEQVHDLQNVGEVN
jgi:hypothetical protein